MGGFDNDPEAGVYRPVDFTAMPVGAVIPEEFTMADGTVQIGTNFDNARMRWLRDLVANSTTARYGDCFQCDHCGARIRYVGVLRHIPTGDHIAVGQTCMDNRFPLSTAEFQAMRKAAQLDREAHRLLTAWNEYKADHADVDLGRPVRLGQRVRVRCSRQGAPVRQPVGPPVGVHPGGRRPRRQARGQGRRGGRQPDGQGRRPRGHRHRHRSHRVPEVARQ